MSSASVDLTLQHIFFLLKGLMASDPVYLHVPKCLQTGLTVKRSQVLTLKSFVSKLILLFIPQIQSNEDEALPHRSSRTTGEFADS